MLLYFLSLGGFDPPPLTLKLSVRSHYATMTRLHFYIFKYADPPFGWVGIFEYVK